MLTEVKAEIFQSKTEFVTNFSLRSRKRTATLQAPTFMLCKSFPSDLPLSSIVFDVLKFLCSFDELVVPLLASMLSKRLR